MCGRWKAERLERRARSRHLGSGLSTRLWLSVSSVTNVTPGFLRGLGTQPALHAPLSYSLLLIWRPGHPSALTEPDLPFLQQKDNDTSESCSGEAMRRTWKGFRRKKGSHLSDVSFPALVLRTLGVDRGLVGV